MASIATLPVLGVLLLFPASILAVYAYDPLGYGSNGMGVAALEGNSADGMKGSSAYTQADPLGRSLGSASGLASGYSPYSSSVASSVNQASRPFWKRDVSVALFNLTAPNDTAPVFPAARADSSDVSVLIPAARGANVSVILPPAMNVTSRRRRAAEVVIPLTQINDTTTRVLRPSTGQIDLLPTSLVNAKTNDTVPAQLGEVKSAVVNTDQLNKRQRRGFGQYEQYGQYGGQGRNLGDFMGHFGQSAGTAIGTANALQGRSFSSGDTVSHGGYSHSNAMGQADGFQPSSTSIANSQSAMRRRRDAEDMQDDSQDDVDQQQPGVFANMNDQGQDQDPAGFSDRRKREVMMGDEQPSTIILLTPDTPNAPNSPNTPNVNVSSTSLPLTLVAVSSSESSSKF